MGVTDQVWNWITGGITHLVAGLKIAAASFAGRVLGAFGLSVISINGVLPQLKSFLSSYVAMLPPDAANFLGAIGLGQAMAMVLSALSIRLAAKAMIVPTTVANQMGQS